MPPGHAIVPALYIDVATGNQAVHAGPYEEVTDSRAVRAERAGPGFNNQSAAAGRLRVVATDRCHSRAPAASAALGGIRCTPGLAVTAPSARATVRSKLKRGTGERVINRGVYMLAF